MPNAFKNLFIRDRRNFVSGRNKSNMKGIIQILKVVAYLSDVTHHFDANF